MICLAFVKAARPCVIVCLYLRLCYCLSVIGLNCMILEHSLIAFSQHSFAVIVCVIYLVGFVFRIPLSLRRIAGQSEQMVCIFF